jgi:hypothetical protein
VLTYGGRAQAGSFYDIRANADALLEACEAHRSTLAAQEARVAEEDAAFRAPLLTFSRFTRLANADAFAHMHDHERQRALNDYFAAVLLQAYVRRKQARLRYCAARLRAQRTGRFIPITSHVAHAFAPPAAELERISPQKAGLSPPRVRFIRAQHVSALRAAQLGGSASMLRAPTAAARTAAAGVGSPGTGFGAGASHLRPQPPPPRG